VLLDVMYEIPSRQDIRRCKITEKVILKEESPSLEPVRLPQREDDDLLVQDEPA